jgi:hypothetical protein
VCEKTNFFFHSTFAVIPRCRGSVHGGSRGVVRRRDFRFNFSNVVFPNAITR